MAISVYANGSVVYETPPPPFSLTLTVAAAANISGSDTLATATARFTLAAVPPPQMTLTVQHFDGVQLTGTSAFATLHIGGGFNNAGNDYRVTADGVSISLAGSVLVLSVVAIEAQTIIARRIIARGVAIQCGIGIISPIIANGIRAVYAHSKALH